MATKKAFLNGRIVKDKVNKKVLINGRIVKLKGSSTPPEPPPTGGQLWMSWF